MRICRFNDNRVGVVRDGGIHDVTDALGTLPAWRYPLPRFDPPRRVPHGVTLIGRLYDEGTIARVGLALEQSLSVSAERPPGF